MPNIITSFRFFLAVLFFYSFLNWSVYASITIFAASGISDMMDGYLARKYDMVTDVGKVLDPLADKIMTMCVVAALYLKEIVPMWFLVFIFIKEIAMIIGAFYLYTRKEKVVVYANKYGKAATIAFYVCIISILLFPQHVKVFAAILIISLIVAFLSYLKSFYSKVKMGIK